MHRKSLVIFGGMCLSMALGVLFQALLASHLGTSPLADAFYLAISLPTVIAVAILGSAANALVPHAVQDSSLLGLRRRGSVARRLVGVSAVVGAAMLLVGVSGTLASAGETREAFVVLGITSGVPPLATVAALGSVVALVDGRFLLGTWGSAFNGAGLLAATLLFALGRLTSWKLAVGVDVGYAVQAATVVRGVSRRASPLSEIPTEVARATFASFGLLMGASLVYKGQPLVERGVASRLGHGIVAAIGYEDKITQGFTQLAVFGFALATLPNLARILAAGDLRKAREQVEKALAATFVSTVVIVAFGASSCAAVVHILYARGAFEHSAAHRTTVLVASALPTVAAGALAGPLVAAFYAANRVALVIRVGGVGFLLGTAASVVLALTVGYSGIVIGTGIGATTTFVIFASRIRTVLPDWSWRALLRRNLAGAVVLVVGATVVAFGAHQLAGAPASLPEQFAAIAARLAAIALCGVVIVAGHRKRRQQPDVIQTVT